MEKINKMLAGEIQNRELPNLCVSDRFTEQRRAELLDILMHNIYGRTPPPPVHVRGKVTATDQRCCAGKVTEQKITVAFDTPKGDFELPFDLFIPKEVNLPPVILHIAFRSVPDGYIPVEEITDNGFALAVVCYNDIIKDTCDGDFDRELGGMFREGGQRAPDEWGKIGMWAYGASRVMDYLLTLDSIDKNCVSVMGHSRLGKTALWCGAQDRRFFAVMSNESGVGGASVLKHGSGEKVTDFIRCGSIDWFCENFRSFDGRENKMPFDQHFLLACIAPRYLYVASAEIDKGADPRSEFLSCCAASEAYKALGLDGIITPDAYPEPPVSLHEGRIGYHIRKNLHYLSRYDWNEFMRFIKLKAPATIN